MESDDSVADKDSSSSSETLNNVDLQDTYVTLQTKEGQSSQQIPLFQFLEQIMGTRVDNNVKAENISLLLSGCHSSTKSDACKEEREKTPKVSSLEIEIENSTSEDKNSNKTNKAVGESISNETILQKPKGRGRPRKQRLDETIKDTTVKEKNASSSDVSLYTKKKDDSSVVPANTVPILRRSSRIPAKNSRFKDDYVDSSLLPLKAVTSGDTRLMTLALAAECHTTKPNKHSSVASKGESSVDTSAPEKNQKKQKLISSSTNNKQEEASNNTANGKSGDEEKDDNEMQGKQKDVSNFCNPLMTPVLKRPLDNQLSVSISGSKDWLSTEPPQTNDNGPPQVSHFYIIIEPRCKPMGDALLVQKFPKGIQFNVADISNNSSTNALNPEINKFPLDRYFTCETCDKIFHTANQLEEHKRNAHASFPALLNGSLAAEEETFSCKLCKQSFPFQFMLDNHLQRRNQCNSFTCVACDQVFSTKDERDKHHLLAHPIKLCINCGKSFNDSMALQRHLKYCESDLLMQTVPSMEQKVETRELLHKGTIKNETSLTVQQEEVFRQRRDGKSCEAVETENADNPLDKIWCEFCGLKFSTFSGLWYHKLEIHQEYFPEGFKEKLKSRLEKNQQVLSSLSPPYLNTGKDKNTYFVLMRPKWLSSKQQLQVSLENKIFNFAPIESKTAPSFDLSPTSNPKNLAANKLSVFCCNQCSLLFQSASAYREHRSKTHSECFETVRYMGAYQCSYCSDTFPCEFMLKEHLKQHTNKKALPCTLCGLTFNKIQERRQHWKQAHPGVGCPNCGKMYASIKYLQKHISLNCQDHYPASKKFIAFRQKQHNDFHMEEKDKRVEKKIIKCHLCPKICSSIHGWRRHMSENHEDQGFSKLSNTCIICDEVIYGYKALEKHLLEVHAEESGLPIEEENTMVTEAVKKSKVDLQDYLKAGKSQTDIYQDEEGNYHCPECPKTHSDPKALAIHIKTHVNMQLECSVCQKSFKNPTLLKQHVMRHRTTAVYDCDTCHKKFMTLQKLNKHNKVHHSKESFVCELCGMSFALNDYLLKHKRCHTDKRPHLCSVCGKTFRTKPELRVHVLIHTQETPYVCEHCGRGFTQKGNWRIHLAQHTGVKPHQCQFCELSFALPSHLKRHLLTHNQKINYRCIWCDKECTQRKHMQMHVIRVHKEDFFQYEEQMKLENPIPIAPSQLKIYNRRLGKAGQVRKAYRTRAKKCNSSIQDIIDGVPRLDTPEQEVSLSGPTIKQMIGQGEESATSSISFNSQDMVATESMQILVRDDHQNYVKHDIPASLIEEDGSNVEIVMGENNEINIIINNADTPGITTDLSLQDGLDEDGHVSLTHLTDASGQLPNPLQQAVNALVADQKEESVEVTDTELPLDMEAMMTEDNGDNFTIVYPSGS